MEHTDFLQQTISLQQEKVRSLNENMKNRIGREYHWFVDFPYAEMDLDGNGSPIEAKIMAVKYPIGEHNGILIIIRPVSPFPPIFSTENTSIFKYGSRKQKMA